MILAPTNKHVQLMLSNMPERVEATKGLLNEDIRAYKKWWKGLPEHKGKKVKDATSKAEEYMALTLYIAQHGYDADVCRQRSEADGREYHEPLVRVRADGSLLLIHGCHRVLAALCSGHTIEVSVECCSDWAGYIRPYVAGSERLYQPTDHPTLQDVETLPIRPGLERYRLLGEALVERGLTAHEIGCAEGSGLVALHEAGVTQVSGTESHEARYRLAQAALRAHNCGGAVRLTAALPSAPVGGSECLVMLSVLQHACTTWNDVRVVGSRLKRWVAAAVEMPEPGSTTYHSELQGKDVGEKILNKLCEFGEMQRTLIYTDPEYKNRQTWLLTR